MRVRCFAVRCSYHVNSSKILDWRCPGGRRPGRTCPEPPRHLAPPVLRICARWRRFQGPCPGCSISPPWAGHGQKARDWRGAALPGVQEAAGGLPRAPAPTLPASPSPTRALAPFSGRVPGVQYHPPGGRSRAQRRGSGGDWCCPGRSGPQGVCPEPPGQRSPPVPRLRARWRRFQGACPG